MYCLNDAQIDFIRNDLSARGIAMASLQQDLLDHVCCVIEQELDDGDDFERFYVSAIERFYTHNLAEIEAETLFLLTNKNYYLMKKVMLIAGMASVLSLTVGLIFKFMHWPGAAMMIVLGIFALSFLFLPLLFVLKAREQDRSADRAVTAIGVVAAMLMSMGILFKIMHWPYASMLCLLALGLMLFAFLPVYFFTGIRKPESKVNTAVSSILLLCGCALILVLVRRPEASKMQYISETNHFLRNESILQTEENLLGAEPRADLAQTETVLRLCQQVKTYLLKAETGYAALGADFEQKSAWLGETAVKDYFARDATAQTQLRELAQAIREYNVQAAGLNMRAIPLDAALFQNEGQVGTALNDLIQIQMMLLQNQRAVAVN